MEKIISNNLNLCEKLWNQFTPNTSIWDLWKTVLSFYNPSFFQPHFIFLEKDKQKGVLPLWTNPETGRYFFFGGDYPENRTFWFPNEMFPDFFRAMPKLTVLYDINKQSVENIVHLYPQYKKYFTPDENRYYLNLEDINYDLDKYFARFSSKHRKNLLYDTRKLMEGEVRLRWSDNAHNLGHLIKLSKERFVENSDFFEERLLWQFRSFTKYLEEESRILTLSAEINNEVVGVEMSAMFGGVYYVLNGGFDPKYKNLGKLLLLEQIKKASAERCREIDFLVGDTGWKELWNLDQEPVFTLDKEDISEESLSLLDNL
jgi:hypothetical protein